MKKNMGRIDQIVRWVAAAVIAGLYFAHVITGTWAIVLGIVAVIMVVTSLINFCPLYAILGLHTNKPDATK